MIRQFLSRQFLAFLLTGGIAAVVNFCSRILFSRWMSFSSAVILAYVVGMVTAYVLAKLFVFKESRQSAHRSAAFFVLVNLIAVLQTWAVSLVLANYLLPAMGVTKYVQEIAHAVGVAVPVFSSYIGHKRWSFR